MIPREAFCGRCRRVTVTALVNFRPDLVGNCCAVCRACRKGKPYASKRDVAQFNNNPLTPAGADGAIYGKRQG